MSTEVPKKDGSPVHSDKLDPFLDEARAGAKPSWLAEISGVNVRFVYGWLRYHKITYDRTSTAKAIEKADALQGLVANYEPQMHRVDGSLDWDAPEYVIREPLNYTQFSRACYHMLVSLEMTVDQLASGLGVRPQDVRSAVEVWKKHLRSKGTKCLVCDTIIDTRFGEFCSRRCKDEALTA
jgi:hypothetical protein